MSAVHFWEGERIYLRPVVLEDANEEYCRWLNDPEVNQYLETRYVPQTPTAIRAYIESKQGKRDEVFLAICLKKGDRHIGNIKVGPINWLHQVADISLFIGVKEVWGKGYATEAIQLMSRFAFERLNLRKLTAGCYADNNGSEKAFIKAGFSVEARLPQQLFYQGRFVDKICMGLLRAASHRPAQGTISRKGV